MNKSLSLNQKKGVLEQACDNSYLVLVLVRGFDFLVRFGQAGTSAVAFVANGLSRRNAPRAHSWLQSPTLGNTAPVVENVVQKVAPATVGKPIQPEDYVASSRVFAVSLEAAPGVQVGRLWFYLYEERKLIRRVFRIEDPQIQKIMGGRERFYMMDVPWDRASGEEGIEAIKLQAAEDVKVLVHDRASKRAGAKGKPGKANQNQPSLAMQIVKAEPAPKAARPPEVPSINAPAPTPAAAQVSQAVVRPVEGQTYTGVIAEMGHVERPGSHGGASYRAFCLKLEKGGVHTPFYGVELQRELIERAATAGDTVEVVFMGRKPHQNGGGHTNLYRVTVISKGSQQ